MTSKKLPDYCIAKLPSTGEPILINNGEKGYTPIKDHIKGGQTIDSMNAELGVTAGQREAMFAGSMFGWNVPGADPNNYDDAGNYTANR